MKVFLFQRLSGTAPLQENISALQTPLSRKISCASPATDDLDSHKSQADELLHGKKPTPHAWAAGTAWPCRWAAQGCCSTHENSWDELKENEEGTKVRVCSGAETHRSQESFSLFLYGLCMSFQGRKRFFIVCKHSCIDTTRIRNRHSTEVQTVPKYIHEDGSKETFGSPYEHEKKPHLKQLLRQRHLGTGSKSFWKKNAVWDFRLENPSTTGTRCQCPRPLLSYGTSYLWLLDIYYQSEVC